MNPCTPGPLNLSQASLPDSRFDDVNFRGAIFHNVNLSQAIFEDINFSGTKLHNVNLTNVEIDRCNVTGMKIRGILVSDLLAAYKKG